VPEPKSERIIFSATPEFVAKLDRYRASHSNPPTRSKAIRMLVSAGLALPEMEDIPAHLSDVPPEILEAFPRVRQWFVPDEED